MKGDGREELQKFSRMGRDNKRSWTILTPHEHDHD